jgi:hypothetical protein
MSNPVSSPVSLTGEEGTHRFGDGEVRDNRLGTLRPLTYPTPLRYAGPFPLTQKKRARTFTERPNVLKTKTRCKLKFLQIYETD